MTPSGYSPFFLVTIYLAILFGVSYIANIRSYEDFYNKHIVTYNDCILKYRMNVDCVVLTTRFWAIMDHYARDYASPKRALELADQREIYVWVINQYNDC